MTRKQIEALVEAWKARLGLDGWKIAVEFPTVPTASYSEVTVDGSYDSATLTVSPGFEAMTQKVANQTVVHELLHLLIRDMDAVMEDARSQLHPQASAQVEKRYEHEVEGFVDRLAIRIVEIGGCA